MGEESIFFSYFRVEGFFSSLYEDCGIATLTRVAIILLGDTGDFNDHKYHGESLSKSPSQPAQDCHFGKARSYLRSPGLNANLTNTSKPPPPPPCMRDTGAGK